MRIIIAGSRGIQAYHHVQEAVEMAIMVAGLEPTVVLSGKAPGVDELGERWANEHGVPVEAFPALWGKYPKTAGILRNGQMGRRAEGLIAVWDGYSTGTQHMIEWMRKNAKPFWVHEVKIGGPAPG